MDNVTQIPIIGQIVPATTSGYVVDAQYIQGSYIVVDTIAQRDALTDSSIYVDKTIILGTPVYVFSEKTLYRWEGAEAGWVEDKIDLSSIYSSIEKIEADLEGAKTSITELENANVTTNGKLTAINEELVEINTAANLLETKVDENKNKLDNAVADIANKADQSYVNAVAASITSEFSADIIAIEASMNDKADKSELSDYAKTSDLTSINNNIDSLTNNKVDKSVYQSKVQELENDIQDVIDSIPGSIDLSNYATKQDVANAIDDIDLSNFATKTEVNSKLNTSTYNSDKATFATKTDLNSKADKSVVDTISIDLNSKADAADIINLQTQINSATNEIAAHKASGDVEHKKNADAITANTAKINSLEASVNSSVSTLTADKLDKSTYTADKATFALKTEIPSVTDLAKQSAVDAVVSDITEINDALEAIEADVAEKATTSALNSAISTLEGKIVTAKTDTQNNVNRELKPLIQANTDNIALKADAAELSRYALKTELTDKQDQILFTSDAISSTQVGNLEAQRNLKNMTITDIIKAILGVVIPVSAIQLSSQSVELQVNTSTTLSASITPADATDKNITWTVNGDGVTLSATTGSSVSVIAGSSNATATVIATCSNLTAECVINVVGELSAIDDIKTNELALQIGTADDTTSTTFAILSESEASDPANQGFFDFDSKAGYQVIQPNTGRTNLSMAIPSKATLIDLEYYNVLTSAWESWLPDADPRWTETGSDMIDGVEYTKYEINAKGTGLSVRFIIE